MFFTQPLLLRFNRFWRMGAVAVLLALSFLSPLRAQDHTVTFSTSDPGVSRSITNWGLDTTWTDPNNMQRGLIFMGTNHVNVVRVGFLADQPLTNSDISSSQKVTLQSMANMAAMAGPDAKWDMSIATGAGVASWYQSGTGTVYPDRWAAAAAACQRYYKRNMWMVETFNEPDYGWGQGSQQNLYDAIGYEQASTNFPGTLMAGGSTLNCDAATSWYNAIASRASMGTTHILAGSAASYVGFIQNVIANNGVPFNPEAHNVVETIMGANYGLQGVIWWGTAELARGDFVKACQGQRLGYAEDWGKWTAAAVYRGTNGAVQAFLGGSERTGVATSYRFFSKDRDVFYNGDGPRRDYTVSIPADQEKVVNVTWGADVQPVINGRYIVVNRKSGKVMEVAGGSTNNGANIQQYTYTNGLNQQWDIVPFASAYGDQSFYSVTVAHSGKSADVNNFSYSGGANVQQWESLDGVNQKWFFEYIGNGYFYIRSRWSGKYLDVNGASTANGANIQQWSGNGQINQQWRFISVGAPVEFVAPPPPSGVTATASALSVQLHWGTNPAPDLAGYTVLRATNSGGPYEIVARGLTNNAFTDKSANQSRTFFYVVQAVDRSLNTSANSARVTATPTGIPALAARYAFDGNVNDSSGNANHAIVVTGSPAFVTGRYGSAMDLDGTNQSAMLPTGLFASVTNFTIAAWVNWDGGAAWQRIFDFGNDTTQYLFLTPGSGSGTLRFAITTNGGGAEQILETALLPVGQWQHVAVTRNGNTARLYTNGVLAVSGTVTIAPASFNPALNYLGESQYAADPLFNGRLDELFIYNYALTDNEITRLMSSQPPPPNVPTTLSTLFTGGMLNLFWPSNYLGCRLQVQTNALNAGLGTNWVDVPDSTQTNQISLPVNALSGSVFYRLIYP